MDWGQRFFDFFAAELARDGFSPDASARLMWRPAPLDSLRVLGPDRDRDLDKLAVSADDVRAALQRVASSNTASIDRNFYRKQKIILVLVPGYTHETLKNLSWHDQLQRKDSPHHIMLLRPGASATQETLIHAGDGLKLVYAAYPRSNASSEVIVPGLFALLHNSPGLRRWVQDEGYKLFFVGYSNGAPLSLELLAGMNRGQFADEFLLANTVGFLALCGDIGGSYLADDLLCDKPRLFDFRKLLAFARRHPLIAKLLGLGTRQLQDDALDGIRALGHEVRQARMADYAPHLPPHVQYFSVAAVMPMQDYRRRPWGFNFDDWTMYLQARVTDPVTLYNDGQVSLDDNQLPAQLPAEQRIFLGAVRSHHWGVAYRTFNLGRNRFPRAAFYRALMRSIHAAGIHHSA